MPAIGYVTKQPHGGYKSQLKTLRLRADIEIVPNSGKSADNHPDFHVLAKGYELVERTLLLAPIGGPHRLRIPADPRRIYRYALK